MIQIDEVTMNCDTNKVNRQKSLVNSCRGARHDRRRRRGTRLLGSPRDPARRTSSCWARRSCLVLVGIVAVAKGVSMSVHAFQLIRWSIGIRAETRVERIRLRSNAVDDATSPPQERQDEDVSVYATVLPETSPLPPHTFAGMVERELVERFFVDVKSPPPRVLESWRLLDRGYVHDEFVGATRFHRSADTSQCKQYCHSYVPGLSIQEFWNIDDGCFAAEGASRKNWCHFLQSKYPQILREFQQVTSNLDALKAKGNNIWAGALTDDASSYGEGWKTLVLMDRGHWDPINVNLFPVTSKAVHESGVPAVEVFFASMQPNSKIQMHSDFTNFVLTSHLALDIPYSGQNKCRIRVGDEVRQWINGQVMVFDTSLLHDAINESDKTRYILMIRLWHPDLSNVEREALQFTYDCLEIPELLSDDPQERAKAQELALQLRSFPEIVKGKQGFGGAKSGSGSAATKGKTKKRK